MKRKGTALRRSFLSFGTRFRTALPDRTGLRIYHCEGPANSPRLACDSSGYCEIATGASALAMTILEALYRKKAAPPERGSWNASICRLVREEQHQEEQDRDDPGACVDFLDLAKRIAATVKSRIGFTPLVKVVEIGLLPRSEKKTKRVIDERYE